jgi:hypothetical protein
MEREALRGLGPDAGQMFELVDQALDRFREISHDECSVTKCGGPKKQTHKSIIQFSRACHSEERSGEESLWVLPQSAEGFLASLGMTKMGAFLKTSQVHLECLLERDAKGRTQECVKTGRGFSARRCPESHP